jgi:multiple sugar transport system substrate-binding protein
MTAVLLLLLVASVGAGAKGEKSAAMTGPVTLQYAYWGDQNEVVTTTNLMNRFMEAKPNIKVELMHFGTNTEFNDKIVTLAASNTLPDASIFYEPNVLTWGMNNQFMDLTEFYKSAPPKLDAIKFITPDGKIVGISVANEIQVTWYNKKIFTDAGVPFPPAEMSKAWNWDQFVQMSKRLTKDANGRTPNDAGFDPRNIRTFGAWIQQWWMPWITFANSNGGGLTTPDGKTLIMDSPATIDAIQKLADLINVHYVSPVPGTQSTPTAAATALLSQQVAMAIDGTWDLLSLGITKDEQGLDFSVGVLPYMKELVTTSVGGPIVVYRSTKNPAAALELLGYLMDPEQSLPLLQSGIWLPNEMRWYTDPALLSKWIDNPRHPPEYKTAVVDFAASNRVRQLPLYFVPTFARMDDVIGPALNQVWLGQRTAEDVIKNEIMPKIRPIFEGK